MVVTADVLRIHRPVMVVSLTIPRVVAELASLSALLPPIKRAARSSAGREAPRGKKEGSLERLGRVSKSNLKSLQSPSGRSVSRDSGRDSFRADYGRIEPQETVVW
jgi:hypothetical protein